MFARALKDTNPWCSLSFWTILTLITLFSNVLWYYNKWEKPTASGNPDSSRCTNLVRQQDRKLPLFFCWTVPSILYYKIILSLITLFSNVHWYYIKWEQPTASGTPDSSVYKMHQFGAARGKAPFFAGLKKSEGSRGDHMFNFCLAGCIVIC